MPLLKIGINSLGSGGTHTHTHIHTHTHTHIHVHTCTHIHKHTHKYVYWCCRQKQFQQTRCALEGWRTLGLKNWYCHDHHVRLQYETVTKIAYMPQKPQHSNDDFPKPRKSSLYCDVLWHHAYTVTTYKGCKLMSIKSTINWSLP